MHFIYRNEIGGIAVGTIPPEVKEHEECVAYSKPFVPAGQPFKIVAADAFPPDRSQRDAWTIEDSELNDGVGERK